MSQHIIHAAAGCGKALAMDHGRLNASWKISSLAVNGQSFLVIDGYLLILLGNHFFFLDIFSHRIHFTIFGFFRKWASKGLGFPTSPNHLEPAWSGWVKDRSIRRMFKPAAASVSIINPSFVEFWDAAEKSSCNVERLTMERYFLYKLVYYQPFQREVH